MVSPQLADHGADQRHERVQVAPLGAVRVAANALHGGKESLDDSVKDCLEDDAGAGLDHVHPL